MPKKKKALELPLPKYWACRTEGGIRVEEYSSPHGIEDARRRLGSDVLCLLPPYESKDEAAACGLADRRLGVKLIQPCGEGPANSPLWFVAERPGAPTLAEQDRAAVASRTTAAAQDPVVQAVLAAFPGARIEQVRPLPVAAAPAADPSDDDVDDDDYSGDDR